MPRAQKIERREKCEVLARAKQKRISKVPDFNRPNGHVLYRTVERDNTFSSLYDVVT